MRQNSEVESPTPSSQTIVSQAIVLHPVLSSALANLDMQLEDELARYRRQRLGERTARPSGRQNASDRLDLITVPAANRRNPPTAAPSVPVLDERLAGIAAPATAPDAYKPIPAFTASPQPFDAAIAIRKPAQSADGSDSTTPPGSDAVDRYALAQAASPNLDDYLESSEELLRSLADKQAEVQAERSFMQSLLTPLGMGSLLLLLLSSAMFGYIIMNPSSLEALMGKRTNTASSAPGQPPGAAVMPPIQPDLANRQLPVLDPKSLGTLNPGTPSPTVSASPQTAATPQSKPTIAPTTLSPTGQASTANSTTSPSAPPRATQPAASSSSNSSYPARTAAPPPAEPSRAPIQPPVTTFRPAPAANAPAASSRGDGGASYQYKVGIPFENDQTLENARKVVPDAFVRTLPDGRTIVQLGAGRSEAEVKANAQGLRDQGLSSAEVYKR